MSASSSLLSNSSSADEEDCFSFTAGDFELLDFVEFWVEGVGLVVLALLGLAANGISIFILCKDDLRSFFSQLLTVLMLLDSFYLLFSVAEAFRRNFHLASNLHTHLFPHLIFPLHSFFMTASIFMTVAMAVERYRAILFPVGIHLAMHSATHGMRHRRRLQKYVLPVVICAVIISIPRFFELKVVTDSLIPVGKEQGNETEEVDYGPPRIEATSLRTDPLYSLYYVNITRFVFTGAGPMLLLIFFYYRIYHAVCTHNTEHLLVVGGGTASALENEVTNRRKQENALARLFIKVILVFLICHTPRVLINVKEMTLILTADKCHERGMQSYGIWVHVAVCFSHFLLATNASVNIVFYIWQNKTFKGHFLAIFTRRPVGSQQQSTTLLRTSTTTTNTTRGSLQQQRKPRDVVVELHESRL